MMWTLCQKGINFVHFIDRGSITGKFDFFRHEKMWLKLNRISAFKSLHHPFECVQAIFSWPDHFINIYINLFINIKYLIKNMKKLPDHFWIQIYCGFSDNSLCLLDRDVPLVNLSRKFTSTKNSKNTIRFFSFINKSQTLSLPRFDC